MNYRGDQLLFSGPQRHMLRYVPSCALCFCGSKKSATVDQRAAATDQASAVSGTGAAGASGNAQLQTGGTNTSDQGINVQGSFGTRVNTGTDISRAEGPVTVNNTGASLADVSALVGALFERDTSAGGGSPAGNPDPEPDPTPAPESTEWLSQETKDKLKAAAPAAAAVGVALLLFALLRKRK